MKPNLITLRVWGDFACFTRPEMKVERVSYPVMTPSAARGILEAVFWEPQMFYLIDSIRVVKRGRWVSIRRNEVTKVVSLDNAKAWMNSPDKMVPLNAGAGADTDCAQRNMLALQGVEYLITAEVHLSALAQEPRDKLGKYLREVEGRARAGKCFHRPGLGMREFAADFEWEEDADTALRRRTIQLNQSAEQFNEDFGLMLYDVFDLEQRASGFRWLRSEEMAEKERLFEASPADLNKGEQTKRRKTFAMSRSRSTCPPIKPEAAFFHAKVQASRMDCHPSRIHILTSQTGGN